MPLQDTDPTPSFGGFGFSHDVDTRETYSKVRLQKRDFKQAAAALMNKARDHWETEGCCQGPVTALPETLGQQPTQMEGNPARPQ